METVTKHRYRTKHFNVKLYHLRDYMARGKVTIMPKRTLDQASDYPTKAIKQSTLGRNNLTVKVGKSLLEPHGKECKIYVYSL